MPTRKKRRTLAAASQDPILLMGLVWGFGVKAARIFSSRRGSFQSSTLLATLKTLPDSNSFSYQLLLAGSFNQEASAASSVPVRSWPSIFFNKISCSCWLSLIFSPMFRRRSLYCCLIHIYRGGCSFRRSGGGKFNNSLKQGVDEARAGKEGQHQEGDRTRGGLLEEGSPDLGQGFFGIPVDAVDAEFEDLRHLFDRPLVEVSHPEHQLPEPGHLLNDRHYLFHEIGEQLVRIRGGSAVRLHVFGHQGGEFDG